MKVLLRSMLTCLVVILGVMTGQAQIRTYSGTVKSAEDGQPIVGANVVIEGSDQGTSTGVDGSFSIQAKQGSTLVFSYLGMKTQRLVTGTSTTLQITLKSDATSLDDVVVVAFGTAKKKDLTGSLSAIDTKILERQSNSTLSKALEGAIPGVQYSALDGQPGKDAQIVIRGVGSANSNNSALIVIDGVPATSDDALSMLNPRDIESMVVSKDAASNALYGSRGANGVILITTRKGQAGKPRITLDAKWGINQVGPFKLDKITDYADVYEYTWKSLYNAARYRNFEDSKGITTNINNPNMSHEDAALFASQHLFDWDGNTNPNNPSFKRNGLGNYMPYYVPGAIYTPSGDLTSSTMSGAYLVGTDGKINPEARLLWKDDWADEFLQNKFRQEYNLSASGAVENKVDYYVSLGYLSDPSYIKGSDFSRYSARSNINFQATKWLRAGINFAYVRRERQQAPTRYGWNAGDSGENPFYWINGMEAVKPIWAYDENGQVILDENGNRTYDFGTGETYSPLGATRRGISGSSVGRNLGHFLTNDRWTLITNDLSGRGYLEATFLKDFTFTSNLSIDYWGNYQKRYYNQTASAGAGTSGSMRQDMKNSLSLNTQQLLNWSHDFGKHHVDALLGHEYTRDEYRNMLIRQTHSLIPGFEAPANFIGSSNAANYLGGSPFSSDHSISALEGYFFRGNYNYDSKYYVSASLRFDGSSRFRDNTKRWGTFWSVGAAWRLSREAWLSDASWINDLKLRVSYGTMGNASGVGLYSGYNLWTFSNGSTDLVNQQIYQIKRGALGNPNLTWETISTLDVGVDFRFWDRLWGTIVYYRRLTEDMIWNRPVAASVGVTSLTANAASMLNAGLEVELGVNIIQNDNILWDFNLNFAHNKNTLQSLPDGVIDPEIGYIEESHTDGKGNLQFRRAVGKSYYNLQSYKYAGIDPNSGLALYYHKVTEDDHSAGRFIDTPVGGDVTTTDYTLASTYEMGDALPTLTGGFGTSFRYKNFDFSAQFAFQIGGKFFSNEYGYNLYWHENVLGAQVSSDLLNNTWTPENRTAEFPMQMAGQSVYTSGTTVASQRYTNKTLYDASYLSFKNMTIGYNLPDKLIQKWGLGGIRVYVSGDNIALISTKNGIDPRMSMIGGFEVGSMVYPPIRTWSLGVNVTF